MTTSIAVLWLVAHLRTLRTLPLIKCLSSDCITKCSICKICSFGCSFTYWSPITNERNIVWATVQQLRKLGVFCSNKTNIDGIKHCRTADGREFKASEFRYMWYSNIIRTQIHDWSQSSEFPEMSLSWMQNPSKKPQIWLEFGFGTTHL